MISYELGARARALYFTRRASSVWAVEIRPLRSFEAQPEHKVIIKHEIRRRQMALFLTVAFWIRSCSYWKLGAKWMRSKVSMIGLMANGRAEGADIPRARRTPGYLVIVEILNWSCRLRPVFKLRLGMVPSMKEFLWWLRASIFYKYGVSGNSFLYISTKILQLFLWYCNYFLGIKIVLS